MYDYIWEEEQVSSCQPVVFWENILIFGGCVLNTELLNFLKLFKQIIYKIRLSR